MTECSAQAEHLASNSGWKDSLPGDVSAVLGWQNHYSPKYGRCYVLVEYSAKSPKPVIYSEFFDAFETRLLAMCSRSLDSELHCGLTVEPTHPGDCAACQQFIDERMNQ
jgi:hypothetical protein